MSLNYGKLEAMQKREAAKVNEQLEEVIQKNVAATLAVEGLKPSKRAVEITRKYLQGKYTSDQAIMAIKLIYVGGEVK